MLRVLDTGIASAEENMALDAKLLEALGDQPILHLYRWSGPSATYGYFLDPEKHLDLDAVGKYRLHLARRPTGGGIVFHIWDLAFSFLMPSSHPLFSLNTLENYLFVNQIALETMKELFPLLDSPELIPESAPSMGPDCRNFCMAKPTQYDVVYKGRKVAGAAQRKRKQGYLHQGTLSLAFPQMELLSGVLLSKTEVLEAMRAYTFAPLGRAWEPAPLKEARAELERILVRKFMEKL
jgi:lipoate-protein ligase A